MTVPALTAGLRALGLRAGDIVLVHCSLRRVGTGAAELTGALREVLGPRGTVVVPAQTPGNSLTSDAHLAATRGMSDEQRRAYEDSRPGFDPATTPSAGMGALAEHLRTRPGAVRSTHPQTSFAAHGPAAAALMREHALDSHLGEKSPLAALEAADAKVLLLGTGWESCTMLHLAEYRLAVAPALRAYTCWVVVDGRRERLDWPAPHLDATPFPAIGRDLDDRPWVRHGRVGGARARLFPARPAAAETITRMNGMRALSGA